MMRRLYRLRHWLSVSTLIGRSEEERAQADYDSWIETAKWQAKHEPGVV